VPGAAARFSLRKSHWLFLRALQTPLETFGCNSYLIDEMKLFDPDINGQKQKLLSVCYGISRLRT
jgi:hypothetical protein